MLRRVSQIGLEKILRRMLGMAALALATGSPVWASQNIQLTWNASTGNTVAGYKIFYGTVSGVYPNVADAGNATSLSLTGLADGSTNYFAAKSYDSAGNLSPLSSEIVYVAPLPVVTNNSSGSTTSGSGSTSGSTAGGSSSASTGLSVLNGVTVTTYSNLPESVVISWQPTADAGFAGYLVSYGTGNNTPTVVPAWQKTSLVITGLVAGVTNYFSVRSYDTYWNMGPSSALVGWSDGTAQTVIIDPGTTNTNTTSGSNTNTDSGSTTNIVSTGGGSTDGSSTGATNTVSSGTDNSGNTSGGSTNGVGSTIGGSTTSTNSTDTSTAGAATNNPPTLDVLTDLSVSMNCATQLVALTGISAGGDDKQNLTITATSSNPKLIANPTVVYASPADSGYLLFKPTVNMVGSVTITVQVVDSGNDNNTTTQSFLINVANATKLAAVPKITQQIKNITAVAGKNVTLNIGANGPGPLKYQWMFNGVNIKGATAATLTIKNIKPSQTGNYSVAISNKVGKTVSSLAYVTVISGKPTATTVATSSGPQSGRLVANAQVAPDQTPQLSTPVKTSTQFSFQVTGAAAQYVVLASDDLQHWTGVQTNVPPFNFVDNQVASHPQRYYRVSTQP